MNEDTETTNRTAVAGRDSSGLLACPFCGGEAKPTAHLTYSWFAPVCKSCGVRGPTVRIEPGTDPQTMCELMNKADALWNTRAG